jgi:zinc transporter ZupT
MIEAMLLAVGLDRVASSCPWIVAPGVSMIVGGAFALTLRIPDKIQAIAQNFSAGLLISAVAGELYPLMAPPGLDSISASIAVTAGFACGLTFMLGLGAIPSGEEDEDDSGEPHSPRVSSISVNLLDAGEQALALQSFSGLADRLQADVRKLQDRIPTGHRDDIDAVVHEISHHVDQAHRSLSLTPPLSQRDIDRMVFHCGELATQSDALMRKSTVAEQRAALKLFSGTLDHIHEHAERRRFQRWKPEPLPYEESAPAAKAAKIPWPLVGSVVADGGIDGLLIGLAYAASPGAGRAMSIATCIEMGFLGLSFSASMCNATASGLMRTLLLLLPPVALIVCGLLGTEMGDALESNPSIFAGFIGFSVVCLLFLVTQELLAEAREVGGQDILINATLFAGLLGGIHLSTFVG